MTTWKKGLFLLLCVVAVPPPLRSTDSSQRRGLSKAHFWPLKICGSRCFKSGLGNTASTALPTYTWVRKKYFSSLQFNTFLYIQILFNTFQYISIQFNTFEYNSIQFDSIQYNSTHFITFQNTRNRFNIRNHFYPLCFVVVARRVLKGSSSNAAVQLP